MWHAKRFLADLIDQRQRPHTLLVMRLADMYVMHPQQDNSRVCSACGAAVGIYPSGQAALKRYRAMLIVCQRCKAWTQDAHPAPGALAEIGQSVPVP